MKTIGEFIMGSVPRPTIPLRSDFDSHEAYMKAVDDYLRESKRYQAEGHRIIMRNLVVTGICLLLTLMAQLYLLRCRS